jgi:hypothetical protein
MSKILLELGFKPLSYQWGLLSVICDIKGQGSLTEGEVRLCAVDLLVLNSLHQLLLMLKLNFSLF